MESTRPFLRSSLSLSLSLLSLSPAVLPSRFSSPVLHHSRLPYSSHIYLPALDVSCHPLFSCSLYHRLRDLPSSLFSVSAGVSACTPSSPLVPLFRQMLSVSLSRFLSVVSLPIPIHIANHPSSSDNPRAASSPLAFPPCFVIPVFLHPRYSFSSFAVSCLWLFTLHTFSRTLPYDPPPHDNFHVSLIPPIVTRAFVVFCASQFCVYKSPLLNLP